MFSDQEDAAVMQDVAAVQIPDGYEAVGAAEVVEQGPTSVRLRAGTTTVEVTVLSPDLFRVGMFPDSRPVVYPDAAIARHDWAAGEVTIAEESGSLRLETGAAAVVIDLDPLRIGFRDGSGRPFLEDDPELGMGAAGPAPPRWAGRSTSTSGASPESAISAAANAPAGWRRPRRIRSSGTSTRPSATTRP